MNFNVGDALANIKATRDAKVERDYNDSLQDIQEKYSGVLDVEGGIMKGGATTLGVIGATKSVKDIYTKYKEKVADFKQKLQDFKDKQSGKKSSEEDNDPDGDGEVADAETGEPSEFMEALQNDDFDTMRSLLDQEGQELGVGTEPSEPSGIGEFDIGEDNPFEVGGSDLMQGIKDIGSGIKDRVMQVVRQQQEPQVGETELAPSEGEIPTTELESGTYTTSEPSGSGLGDIELSESVAKGTNQPSAETGDEGFTGTGDDAGDAIADIAGDTEATTDAVSSTAGAVSDVAAGVGEAADVGATIGLESAGAALDATGVGAPIGAILGILGLVVGTGATIGSTIAEGVSSGQEQSETTTAQEQEESDLANPPDYAGKFASNVRTSVAGFL